MSQHTHAHLMKQYAEDALKSDKPWELWEFRNHTTEEWGSLCHQSPSWGLYAEYRRKPKEYKLSEADWQRVIDGSFLVQRDPTDSVDDSVLFIAKTEGYTVKAMMQKGMKPVREKGLRQPHFVGDMHPDGDAKVCIRYSNSGYCHSLYEAGVVNWVNVVEYICLD